MDFLSSFVGLFWLVVMLIILVYFQRMLHRETQAIFLILTRRPDVTHVAFAIIFFPGVLLHELSHFLVAKLLGVRTGRFSVLPSHTVDGSLILGYVELETGGLIRDALIGVAPLLIGSLFVVYCAIYQMDLLPLWDLLRTGNWTLFWMGVGILPQIHGFWLWFYLTFVVSSMMMPSTSDRHAWLPLGLLIGVLFSLVLLAGVGPWMLENLAPPVDDYLGGLAAIFGLSSVVHAFLLLPITLIHRILTKLTGIDIKL